MKRTAVVLLVTLAALLSLLLAVLAPAFAGLAVLVMVLVWHQQLSAAIAPRRETRAPRPQYPSVTVIRPVRGKDVGAAENFAAALNTGYPGEIETLFIFDDESDPGIAVARSVVERHIASGRPGWAEVIVAGAPPSGRTGKLNAMVVGEHLARGELIAFGDSDTRPDQCVLKELVDTLLASPENGAAFAPVLVHTPPRGLGDAYYALMQNALYSPLAAWASGERRELPFIMGQLMVFRREALEAIGGVECADGQLVDDMYIGKCVYQAGYKNVMSRHRLHIATGGMSLRQFLPVLLRWMMFSRNGLPFSFTLWQWLQGLEFFVALIALATALATGHGLAALPAAAAMFAQAASMLVLNRRYGGAPIPLRWAWTPLAVFLIAPYVQITNLLDRKVVWRGREYRVNNAAALAAPAPASARHSS